MAAAVTTATNTVATAVAAESQRGDWTLKVEFIPFSGKNGRLWKLDWAIVHRVNAADMGCEEAFDVHTSEVVKIGRNAFDKSDVGATNFRQAETAWRTLNTRTTGVNVAFRVVVRADSPSEAWTNLRRYYQRDTTRGIRRLTRELNRIAMRPGEKHLEFTLPLNRVAQHFTMLGHETPGNRVLVAIVNGLVDQYDTQRQF